MKKTIAVLKGDGVGPEVVTAGMRVIEKVARRFGHTVTFREEPIGASAIDQTGNPLPDRTLAACRNSDAILFGAIGDPKYDNDPTLKVRPEQGLLKLRQELGLFANVRPVSVFRGISGNTPLRPEIAAESDLVVIRELTGGIYFGKKGRRKAGKEAYDICSYSTAEIERVAQVAFKMAMKRKKKVTLVDKANVLETSRLWREVVGRIALGYPSVQFEKMFVDNAAMQLMKRPAAFDVILTENMFGDILTDEASVIVGSLGMLPSASIGAKTALYEPIHGSYPKAAGKNIANPVGTILSAAMMFEYSFGLNKEGLAIRRAVETVLGKGYGTKDIFPDRPRSTTDVTDEIVRAIAKGPI